MKRIKIRKLWLRYEALAMLRNWDEKDRSNLTQADSNLLYAMCEKAEAKWKKALYASLPLSYQLDTNENIRIGKPSTRAGLDVSMF